MVFGMVVVRLNGQDALCMGQHGVVFSKFFTAQGNDLNMTRRVRFIGEQVREHWAVLVQQHEQSVRKWTTRKSKSTTETGASLNDQDHSHGLVTENVVEDPNEFEEHLLRVKPSDLFVEGQNLIWKKVYPNSAFVLVCEKTENLLAAAQVLQLLPTAFNSVVMKMVRDGLIFLENMTDNDRSDHNGSGIENKTLQSPTKRKHAHVTLDRIEEAIKDFPEVGMIVLNYFLPNGLLPFFTPDMFHQIQEEMLNTM